MHNNDKATPESDPSIPGYVAPVVEAVITAKELEREVQYAGVASNIKPR